MGGHGVHVDWAVGWVGGHAWLTAAAEEWASPDMAAAPWRRPRRLVVAAAAACWVVWPTGCLGWPALGVAVELIHRAVGCEARLWLPNPGCLPAK